MSDHTKNDEIEKAMNQADIYRLIVTHVVDYGIFAIDPKGNIQTWNKGAEKLKGYTAKEIIGRNFSIFYTEEDILRQHPQYELEKAFETGRFEEEGWRIKKDGSRFWANIIITKLLDKTGAFIGYAKVTRDLSLRKEAEEKLRLSEERARLLTRVVKDYAIFMLDPMGNVVSWNEGAERIKQYKPDEIIGKHFSTFYPQEDIDNLKPEMELREASSKGRFEEEGWRIKKDGTRFWANVILTAIHDKGELIGFSKITRDLSERKIAEEKLREANENLELKVKERTLELKKLTEHLEQAVKARDEFLSIASHELKTPLTTLKLQTQMRKRNLEREDQNYSKEKLKQIALDDETQIGRLIRLVDDMLDITRMGTGKLSLHREEMDLASLIHTVIDRYRPQIEPSGCDLSVVSTGKVIGNWDPFRIEQVFTNILTNAMKYGANKPIKVTVAMKERVASLVVEDQGRGISPEDQERIFLQFERATPIRDISGLGLGLFIVKGIVEAHQGTIRVESALKSGSKFIVELPTFLKN